MTYNTLHTVICALNSKYIHSSLAPWYLKAGVDALCEKNIPVKIVESTINEKLSDISDRILQERPDVVGFSCYIWNIGAVKKLLRIIKNALPEVVIVLGGPEVSYNAAEILDSEPDVEFIISGEGEKPLALLLSTLLRGGDMSVIPGLCFREGGQLKISQPFFSSDDPPDPYSEEYFIALNGRIAYLETGRGCPYSCAFCLSSCGTVRFFDIEKAKRSLVALSKSGARTIKLVDRTFNANRKRAYEIIKFILDSYDADIPTNVCFHFEIAGDLLDNETITLLASAPPGLFQLEIGLQSFNRRTLEAINRRTDTDLLTENIRKVVSSRNIHIHIDLIAGLPNEDLQSFESSFNTAYSLAPDMLQLGFLKLLHGAPMREEQSRFPCKYDIEAPYEVTETPWLSAEELRSLHLTEDALERLYNSGRFRLTLDYALSLSGMSPFMLFTDFGRYCANKAISGIALNEYTALVYEYFSGLKGIDKLRLRDIMVCDHISTNASGRLPPVLQIKDKALRHAAYRIKNRPLDSRNKTGIAILYTENCIVFSDYSVKNPVTGRYDLTKISI